MRLFSYFYTPFKYCSLSSESRDISTFQLKATTIKSMCYIQEKITNLYLYKIIAWGYKLRSQHFCHVASTRWRLVFARRQNRQSYIGLGLLVIIHIVTYFNTHKKTFATTVRYVLPVTFSNVFLLTMGSGGVV